MTVARNNHMGVSFNSALQNTVIVRINAVCDGLLRMDRARNFRHVRDCFVNPLRRPSETFRRESAQPPLQSVRRC